MIKPESLQYAGHGHRTGSGISITDLDSNTATIRKSNGVDRFGPSLGNETRDGTMQFQLVTPSARDVLRMVSNCRRNLKLGHGCAGDTPEGARQRIRRNRIQRCAAAVYRQVGGLFMSKIIDCLHDRRAGSDDRDRDSWQRPHRSAR